MGLFDGKRGLVFGVANDRSIAWAISDVLFAEGAEIGFTHLPGDRNEHRVRKCVEPHGTKLLMPCDVSKDEDLDAVFAKAKETYGTIDFIVHSIAFASTDELRKPYVGASRAGWLQAMEISAYSLVAMAQRAGDLMPNGGSIVTMTYYGGEKVMPGYNLMGICKAALEHSVRYLAWDLGRSGIRVNSISAGPLRTLATGPLPDFHKMMELQAERSCLGRNIEPEEVGKTAAFLLSDLSSGVTGEMIHVDSGFHAVGR